MPRPSSPLDAKASTRCPSFTSLPSPRPSRKTRGQKTEHRRQRGRSQNADGILSSVFCILLSVACRLSSAEAGQHTHAVEHAHTMPPPGPKTKGQRSTGACPRSLARHSPCHHNDPASPPPRGLSGRPAIALFAGLWPAGRGPREVARLRGVSWWARADSNGRPHPYQGCALTS